MAKVKFLGYVPTESAAAEKFLSSLNLSEGGLSLPVGTDYTATSVELPAAEEISPNTDEFEPFTVLFVRAEVKQSNKTKGIHKITIPGVLGTISVGTILRFDVEEKESKAGKKYRTVINCGKA